MTGKTHIAIGVASALAVAPLAGAPLGVPTDVVPQAIALALGGMVGGMLPDTDTPSSMGARGTRRVWAALAVMAAALLVVDHVRGSDLALTLASGFSYEQLAGLAIVVATCAVGRASGHRGFSHSLVALALVGYGTWMLCRPIAVAVAVGYASHLALDLTNKRGAGSCGHGGGCSASVSSSPVALRIGRSSCWALRLRPSWWQRACS